MRRFKIALVQLAVCAEKNINLQRAADKVKEAAKNGASIVALPECFNSPYGTNYFKEYAENIPGTSSTKLSKMAEENGIYLIGGSIPEKENDKYYNTCTIWDPKGNMVGKHRKMHLFDIDIPNGIKFKESEVLSPGNNFTVIDHPVCKVGIGICYDIRFAEMAHAYARKDCKLLVYPGAFNMTTGPLHWELLQRGRAVDNQVYVATVSPARDTNASYVAWGHSTLVSPFGEVIEKTDHEESIVYGDIDMDFIDKVRQMVPITMQRRPEIYQEYLNIN